MSDGLGRRNLRPLDHTLVLKNGFPMTFQSDNGKAFIGDLTKELMRRSNIAHAHSTTYHPQTNGHVEMQNRTLMNMFRVYCSKCMTDNDKIIQATPYAVGQYVWVFQNFIPPKGTKNLSKNWREPFMVTEVHQQGRFYRLSTGRAAHYENLKPHVPSPENWCVP